MKISIDAMGGDNAPKVVIDGCVQAVKEYGVNLILAGPRETIEKELEGYDFDRTKIEIIDAQDVITNEDKPVKAIKRKKESSMVKAIEAVKNGDAQAVVSAGSTGALLAGGTLLIGRIPGVKRPCLCPGIPNKTGGLTIISDGGANSDCRSEYLLQFAKMGSIYSRDVLGINNPRVALISNGAEDEKGNALTVESHKLLRVEDSINFTGNIEGRDVLDGDTDVIVCDGFTGNVILKTCEGVAMTVMGLIKEGIMSSTKAKIGGMLIKDSLRGLKAKFDYTEYGGAPLLGVKGGVIKAHGSSDAKAIKNAIRQAKLFIENDVLEHITEAISKEKESAID